MRRALHQIARAVVTFLLGTTVVAAAPSSMKDYYSIESIATPDGVDPQVGGLDALPDGRIAVGFQRGEVCFFDPATRSWSRFAEGLHLPLGLLARSDREVIVMQRPELTRLSDADGDGHADRYETLWDGFGLTGNYHEFAYGPVAAPDGALFVALNLGSNGDAVHDEIRGPWARLGFSHDDFILRWNDIKPRLWGMYSRVPWRGWVMRFDPSTRTAEPWSCGWRSPDGIGFDAGGRLCVTDNQGDWIGTSSLAVTARGLFHQHPASLVWRADAVNDPQERDQQEFARMRSLPAVLFPHGVMANSPTQPLADRTGGRFGPFAGQLIVGEMNTPRLVRVMLETVGGTVQGACTPFFDGGGLHSGNHRLAFSADGSLWVGQIHLAWAGGEGLQRLRWNGRTPLEVLKAELQPGGFLLTFTRPVDPASIPPATSWTIRHYHYAYHATYGSPALDVTPVVPMAVDLQSDGRQLQIALPSITAGGEVYEFILPALTAADSLPDPPESLVNRLMCYTVNVLP